jgi:hypothetical protein
MQKVHGPAIVTPVGARHGYLDQPGVLVVSLSLLLLLCALIYFGFLGNA